MSSTRKKIYNKIKTLKSAIIAKKMTNMSRKSYTHKLKDKLNGLIHVRNSWYETPNGYTVGTRKIKGPKMISLKHIEYRNIPPLKGSPFDSPIKGSPLYDPLKNDITLNVSPIKGSPLYNPVRKVSNLNKKLNSLFELKKGWKPMRKLSLARPIIKRKPHKSPRPRVYNPRIINKKFIP